MNRTAFNEKNSLFVNEVLQFTLQSSGL